MNTQQLPHKLKHLTLSCYSEGGGVDLELPRELARLEYLSLKADYVVSHACCAQTARGLRPAGCTAVAVVRLYPG